MQAKRIVFAGNSESLNRPAWFQGDLRAYRHYHGSKGTKKDYYVKTGGLLANGK